MGQREFREILGGLLIAGVVVSFATADDVKWDKATLSKFLTAGWDTTPEGRAFVDQQFEELQVISKGDTRLNYALGLIRVKQLKYQDALKLFGEISASQKKDLYAWRAKIWLTVLTKNYSQAMLDMEKASAALPPMNDEADQQKDLHEGFARFLGRIYGYLEGPVATATDEADRVAQRKKVVARLNPDLRKVFEEGRQTVTDKYLELTDQAIVSKEKAKEDAEENRDEQLKNIDDEQKQLEKRRDDVMSLRDKLRGELKAELDDLAKQIGPLDARFTRLDAQASSVRRELGSINLQISQLRGQIEREKNPAIRDQLSFELGRLNQIATRLDGNFAGLSREAAGVEAQRAQIRQRAAQANLTFGKQIEAADKELGDVQKKNNRNVAIEKKLRKPPSADTPETRAKAAQAASFVTYEQFPIEREKARLIESFE